MADEGQVVLQSRCGEEARESYQVATTKVYPVTLFRRTKPTDAYFAVALTKAEARLALAGYRLGEAPFAARDKFVQLDAGQLTYQPGEQADIRARLRDAEGRPVSDASVNAVLYRDGQKVATITLSPDEGGLYRGRTTALDSGAYEIAVDTAAVPAEQLKARTQFTVTPRENVERTLLSLNEDLLRQVSLAGGGEYLREEQCDALVDRLAPLSSGQVIESDTVLWQSWWWFLPIVLLLTIEWILRKRFGML